MKETLILILAAASLICSAFTSCVYAYIAWKKSKEPPKDETWEAAVRIMCAKNSVSQEDAEAFAEFYEALAVFNKVLDKKKAEELRTYLRQLEERSDNLKDQTGGTGTP